MLEDIGAISIGVALAVAVLKLSELLIARLRNGKGASALPPGCTALDRVETRNVVRSEIARIHRHIAEHDAGSQRIFSAFEAFVTANQKAMDASAHSMEKVYDLLVRLEANHRQ